MTDLTDRINIGKDTAAKLIKVGINSIFTGGIRIGHLITYCGAQTVPTYL